MNQSAFPPHDAFFHDASSQSAFSHDAFFHDALSSSSTSTRDKTEHSSFTSKINEQKHYNFLNDQNEEMKQCQKSSTFNDSNRFIERSFRIAEKVHHQEQRI